MKLSPNVGDPIYVLGQRLIGRPYYREMRVVRVTYATLVLKDLLDKEHRFWRESRRCIGCDNWYATLEKPDPQRFTVAGCDKGKSW